jgi:hypothetical protein
MAGAVRALSITSGYSIATLSARLSGPGDVGAKPVPKCGALRAWRGSLGIDDVVGEILRPRRFGKADDTTLVEMARYQHGWEQRRALSRQCCLEQ